MRAYSPALSDYMEGFADPDEPFLTSYSIMPDGSVERHHWTRGDFWSLALKAAHVLRGSGATEGTCVAHFLSANRPADLAFRLGATMVGAVPVTINWQADTPERIAYKVRLTQCRLVITDAGVREESWRELARECPGPEAFSVEELGAQPELEPDRFCRGDALNEESIRIVIFTSGTTGQPKGVRLPYRSYATNRDTFESFLQVGAQDELALLIVNPLHHTNSTAFTDWALRRPRTRLHLVERYSTRYWAILTEVARASTGRVVAPLVSRHFDFLENLRREARLPVELEALREAMGRVDFLLGSAPVGPTTVRRVLEYSGRLPLVRFGSTETCLQVLGTPRGTDPGRAWQAFEAGWSHKWNGERHCGYYVGRPHPPHTEVRVVRSVVPGEPDYFVDCEQGEPGRLITRGRNLMHGYARDELATRQVLREDGWYTGFGDICFWLTDRHSGERDYYWMSRESALLVRGGANYSCAQVAAELKAFIVRRFALDEDALGVAAVGLHIESEHEDACCVTVELLSPEAESKREEIARHFLSEARRAVSKGARPDRLRFAPIPRNFKGAVLIPELKKAYAAAIEAGETLAAGAPGP